MPSETTLFARAYLAGTVADKQGIEGLPYNLLDEQAWDLARRVAARLLKQELDPQARSAVGWAQARALARDDELRPASRYTAALTVLERECALPSTDAPEVLGLAGSIHKQRWKLDGDPIHLERSLACYRRSLDGGERLERLERDGGATALKAAYTLDLMGSLARDGGSEAEPDPASARRQEADALRKVVVAVLVEDEDDARRLLWRAEALWGLGEWDQAGELLANVRQLGTIDEARLAKGARRLARLAALRGEEPDDWQKSAPGRALARLLGDRPHVLASPGSGRVGLALAGRGLRATCFHVGVLARLAELGLLGQVEVLSGTSGGAITAAQWFLELRRLLKTREDARIDGPALREAVQRVAAAVSQAVSRDLSARVASGPLSAARVVVQPGGSTGNALADVLSRELLDSVDDGLASTPRLMSSLAVQPLGEDADFSAAANWRRQTRAPELALVATNAATGHAFHFTLDGLGEPASRLPAEGDGRGRLREVEYRAGSKGRQAALATAVAAATALPGHVDPVRLSGLYPVGDVDLCDGGLADPLAVGPLIDRGCTVLVVVDGGGDGAPQELAEQRLRQLETARLRRMRADGRLAGLAVVHLKEGLAEDPVDWVDCEDPTGRSDADGGLDSRLTPAGIERSVLGQLVALRGDLGALSGMDAAMLMSAGHRIASHVLPDALPRLSGRGPTARGDWSFLAVDAVLTGELEQDDRAVAVLRSLELRRASSPGSRARALLLVLGGWLGRRLRLLTGRVKGFGVDPADWRD